MYMYTCMYICVYLFHHQTRHRVNPWPHRPPRPRGPFARDATRLQRLRDQSIDLSISISISIYVYTSSTIKPGLKVAGRVEPPARAARYIHVYQKRGRESNLSIHIYMYIPRLSSTPPDWLLAAPSPPHAPLVRSRRDATLAPARTRARRAGARAR